MMLSAAFSHFIFVKSRRIAVLNRQGKLKRSRSGRRRNPNAIRDTSGKSRGESEQSIMAVALAQPHRRTLPEKDRSHAMAGYPLGWLRLSGRITVPQYAAGQRYAEVVSRYLAAIHAPNADTVVRHAGTGEGISREEYRRRKAAYDEAFEAMTHNEAREVARVAVHQRPLVSFAYLCSGLDALVELWGLTAGQKRASGEIRC